MTKTYLITARNKENSKFSIRIIGTKETNREGYKVTDEKKTEKEIIDMIGDGDKFNTINPTSDTLSPVITVEGDVKSKANQTKLDNISHLPIKL